MLVSLIGCTTTEVDSGPGGTIYVSDYSADAVVRYDGRTGELIDVFAQGYEDHVDRPANVRLGPDGNLYVAGFGHGDIVRFDMATREMMDVFYRDTGVLEEPVELLFHGDELVVLGNDTQNAVIVSRDGVSRRNFGHPTMRAAHDFAFGPDGYLYVATESHPQLGTSIQVWDLATGSLVRSFGRAADGEISFATSLAFDHFGTLYVTDYIAGQVMRFDPATGEYLDTRIDGLEYPVGLELGTDGKLYVLDELGIRRFDADSGDDEGVLVPVEEPLRRPRGFRFLAN